MRWQTLVFSQVTLFYVGVVAVYFYNFAILGVIVAAMFAPVYVATIFALRSTMGKKTILSGYRRVYIHLKDGVHYQNISFRPKWDEWPSEYIQHLIPRNVKRLPKGWLPTEGKWNFVLRTKRKLEKVSFDPAGYVILELKDKELKPLFYNELIQKDDSLLLSPQLFEFRRKHNFPEEMYKAAKRSVRSPLGSLPMILLIMGVMVVGFMVLRYLGVV